MNLKMIIKTLLIITMISVSSLPVPAAAAEETTAADVEAMAIDITDVAKQMITSANEPGTAAGMMQLTAVLSEQIIEAKPAAAVSAAAYKGGAYTEEDLYILAHVICGEAQGYTAQEQLYVGSVVLNRVHSPSYPNTIKGVVFQKGQYACTRDGNYYRTPTEQNWANARYLLDNGSVLPANVVYQSGQRQGRGTYIKTARHYYCYQ